MKEYSDRIMQFLIGVGSRGDITSVFVIVLVGFIILPLPTFLLDLFLVLNILLALIVLLRGLSLNEPMRLFAFPTILLFATLFRLALNVSSTRLILLHGSDSGLSAAGQVIGSFGNFVVSGDFVVGCILFLLIAVVNFVVIAKGSARVAEVAARFVLDAMPGKQLAIDADLRAGIIDQTGAALRRDELAQESRFYGAMDGAMKFVQGDAVAGLVIVFINAVGGMALGAYRGMPLGDAVQVFGVLAIGDGLVNIIPSLLMSLSAGVIVTHVAGSKQRGSGGEMFVQLVSEPAALITSGAALVIAALLPGVPFFPFFSVGAALLLFVAWMKKLALASNLPTANSNYQQSFEPLFSPRSATGISWDPSVGGQRGSTPALEFSEKPDKLNEQRELDTISLKVAGDLYASYFSGKLPSVFAGDKTEELAARHWQMVILERGISLPPLRVQLDAELERGEYAVTVRGRPVRKGLVSGEQTFITLNPSAVVALGIPVVASGTHPIDRRVGSWVVKNAAGMDAIVELGAQILGVEDYLIQESLAAALEVASEIFGLDEVKKLIHQLREEHAPLVEEVFDKGTISYAEFTEVLRRLVRERVSIRDLKLIAEGVSEFAALHRDIEDRVEWLDALHSFLRVVLARGILQEAMGGDESLRVFLLSTDVEEEFREAMKGWVSRRSRPPVDPEIEGRLCDTAKKMFHPAIERGNLPVVILCAGDIRHAAQEFFVRQLGAAEWLRILAYEELSDGVSPESVGVLRC